MKDEATLLCVKMSQIWTQTHNSKNYQLINKKKDFLLILEVHCVQMLQMFLMKTELNYKDPSHIWREREEINPNNNNKVLNVLQGGLWGSLLCKTAELACVETC